MGHEVGWDQPIVQVIIGSSAGASGLPGRLVVSEGRLRFYKLPLPTSVGVHQPQRRVSGEDDHGPVR